VELALADRTVSGKAAVLDDQSGVSTATPREEADDQGSRIPNRDLVLLVHPMMVAMVARSFGTIRYILIVDPEAEPGVIREGSRYLGVDSMSSDKS
jgi:hypothetical protein